MAAKAPVIVATSNIRKIADKATLLASTAIAAVAWIVAPTSPARAVDTIFTGANATADWTDSGNWNTAAAPTNADKALVTTAGQSALISAAGIGQVGSAASVAIDLGNNLTVTNPGSSLGVAGTIDVINGSFTVGGGGVVTAGGTLTTTQGALQVDTVSQVAANAVSNGAAGTVVVDNATLTSTTTIANAGTITVVNGATLAAGTTFTNTGTVTAAGGAINGLIDNNTGGQFNVTGTVSSDTAFNNASPTSALNVKAAGVYTIAGALTNAGSITTDLGGVLNAASISNAAIATITNAGTLSSVGSAISNAGVLNTSGQVAGGLSNTGTVTASGGNINGAIDNGAGGQFNVTGVVGSNSTFDNSTTTSNLSVSSGGDYTVTGLITNNGLVTVAGGGTLTSNTGILNNATGAVLNNGTVNDDLNNAGLVNNNGTYNGRVASNFGTINNNTAGDWTGDVTSNAGTINNAAGSWSGNVVANTGTINNNAAGTWTGSVISNAGTINNQAAATWIGNAVSTGTLQNDGAWIGTVSNAGIFNNAGSVSGLVTNTAGTTTNTSTIDGGVNVTGGTFTQSAGTVNNGLTNAATVNVSGGSINGTVINNAGGTFNVGGIVTTTGTFDNTATTSSLQINSGSYTVSGLLTNSGTLTVAAGAALSANGGLTNNLTGLVTNNGTVNDDLDNAGVVNNNAVYNANVATNSGTINNNAAGIWTGKVLSNATGTINNLTGAFWNGSATNDGGTILNQAGAIWNGDATNSGLITNDGVWVTTGTGFANNAGGTLTTTGIIDATNGGLTNLGVVNAQGIIFGTIKNQATFNQTGDLTINASLTNASTGTYNANLVAGTTTLTNTGAFVLTNAGTFNAGQVAGSAGSTTNIAATGILTATNSGALNLRGTLNFDGTAGSKITNTTTGVINMANGNTSDAVNAISGGIKYVAAAGSQIRADIDLSKAGSLTGQSDVLRTATATGSTTVVLTPNNILRGLITTPIPVITTLAPGTALNATAAWGSASGPQILTGALFNYRLQKDAAGGAPGYSVISTLDPGYASGPLSNILASLNTIATSFHQPTSAIIASPQSIEPNKWVGGPWARVSGGYTVSRADASVTSFGIADSADSRVRTTFEGIKAGTDVGVLNMGGTGWNGHIGVSGGEVDTQSSEQLRSGSMKFRVPFVGLYGVLTNGAFFLDTAVRHDIYNLVADSAVAGIYSTSFNGSGNNFSGTAGYRFPLGHTGYQIEPSAGVSVTDSKFDSIVVAAGTAIPGVLGFDTVKSRLAHADLRVSYAGNVQGIVDVVPFAKAGVWHEFENNAGAAIDFRVIPTIPINVSRVGTFYQGSVGANFHLINTGLLGFVRGDVSGGDKFGGWSVNGGARYTFGPG